MTTLHAPAVSAGVLSVIGRRRRNGAWKLGARFRAVAWMGGVELDLTDAELPPHRVELELVAVMGVVTVRVPQDVVVELEGDAITWSIEEGAHDLAAADAPRGVVRISGRAVFGKIHLWLAGPRHEGFVRR